MGSARVIRMKQLAWAMVALLALAPIATADDHDEDDHVGDHDDEWEYRLSVSNGRAVVEMSRESGPNENSIKFEYDLDEASVKFSLESEVGDVENEASMEVEFHQLFEYEDENENGRYDDGEEIVQAFTLAEESQDELVDGIRVSWGPITQSPVMSENGVSGTKFTSSVNVAGGTLRFDFYVFADEATLGPASLEATEIKMDIAILDFPFERNTSAVGLFLETESEVEIDDDSEVDHDEEGIIADAGSALLRFAWKDFADVDGEQKPVETTRLETKTSQEPGEYEFEELLVFSYARGADILHDPTMGVLTATTAGSQSTPGVGAVVLIAVIAAVAIFVRRR